MDLSDIPAVDPAELGFHPFPNQSSFCLADWHWNGGVQKPLGSFQNLVALITHPDFSTNNIKSTNWGCIHSELETSDNKVGWLDEDVGWTHSSVTMMVPISLKRAFNCRSCTRKLHYQWFLSLKAGLCHEGEDTGSWVQP